MKPTGIRAMLPSLNDAEYKLLERYIAEQQVDAIFKLQEEIVSSDKYRSKYDQQVYAYARVHRLATDRIATLKREAGV